MRWGNERKAVGLGEKEQGDFPYARRHQGRGVAQCFGAQWMLLLIVVALSVLLIIHILFKIKAVCSGLQATWESGDVLAYFGSIIGAIATIAAVTYTIRDAEATRAIERSNSIKPLLAATLIAKPYDCLDACSCSDLEQQELNADYLKADIFIEIRSIGHNDRLAVEYPDFFRGGVADCVERILSSGWSRKRECYKPPSIDDEMRYTKIRIKNLGAGPAINMSIRIESETDEIGSPSVAGKVCHSRIMQIPIDGEMSVGIFVDSPEIAQHCSLFLMMKYTDRDGCDYGQAHSFMRMQDDAQNVLLFDSNIQQYPILVNEARRR